MYLFLYACMHMLSHVQNFETPWTVAYQAPLSTGIFQARVLEWVAISSSRGSSQPRDQSNPPLLCLLHFQTDSLPLCHLRSPLCLCIYIDIYKYIHTHIYILLHFSIYILNMSNNLEFAFFANKMQPLGNWNPMIRKA